MKWLNYFLIAFSLFFSIFFFEKFGKHNNIFYGDALGYYSYLPTTFIYHNVTNLDSDDVKNPMPVFLKDYINAGAYDNPKTPLGKTIIQYTIGTAMLELPAFVVGHCVAKIFNYEQNGFSVPYEYALRISNWIFCLLGLWLTYLCLLKFFDKRISLMTALLIFIGTNLLYFTLYQNGMTHLPVFFCYAWLIYLTIKFHEKPDNTKLALISLLCGIIILARPSDLVCVFIPMFYSVFDKQSFHAKISFLKTQLHKWWLVILFFVLPMIPQFVYWKIMSGKFIYYSYGNQGFDFKHPHLIAGWLYPQNGWLQYTPLMILSLVGFFILKKIKSFSFVLPVTFLVYSFLIYSWFCYQYINGFGSRPMIHLYPLLAFPLAAFVDFILQKKMIWKMIGLFFILFFVFVNISFSMKQVKNQLWSEFSTFLFNAHTLFKKEIHYNDLAELDVQALQPDSSQIYKTILLAKNDFESDSVFKNNLMNDSIHKNTFYKMDGEQYSPKFLEAVYSEEKFKGVKYLKVSGRFNVQSSPWYYYWLANFILQIKRGDEQIYWKGCHIDNKIGVSKSENACRIKLFNANNKIWDEVHFYIPLPLHKKLQTGDSIKVWVENEKKGEIWIDDLQLNLCY